MSSNVPYNVVAHCKSSILPLLGILNRMLDTGNMWESSHNTPTNLFPVNSSPLIIRRRMKCCRCHQTLLFGQFCLTENREPLNYHYRMCPSRGNQYHCGNLLCYLFWKPRPHSILACSTRVLLCIVEMGHAGMSRSRKRGCCWVEWSV